MIWSAFIGAFAGSLIAIALVALFAGKVFQKDVDPGVRRALNELPPYPIDENGNLRDHEPPDDDEDEGQNLRL